MVALPGGTRSVQTKTSWLHFLTQFAADQDEISYDVESIQAELPDTIFGWELMTQGK